MADGLQAFDEAVSRTGFRDVPQHMATADRWCYSRQSTIWGECPERQRGRTVNPLSYDFVGSSPTSPTNLLHNRKPLTKLRNNCRTTSCQHIISVQKLYALKDGSRLSRAFTL
jgi:hypothetical protein